ncbi:unnamed protein product, partial [Lymnaea stagnalis]
NSPNYHPAKCLIVDLDDKELNFLNFSVKSFYKKSSEDQTCNSTCVFQIPINNIIPGQYPLIITMFPNVTGSNDDKYFGTNQSILINLEYPSVKLAHCPELVVENIEVNCTCERSDTSLIKAPLVWFDKISSKPVHKVTSHLLTFVAKRKTKGAFFCKAITSSHWTNDNSTVYYSPSVLGNLSILQEVSIIDPLKFQLILTCVIGGNVFILSLMIIILYKKQNGSSEIHDYDQINEIYHIDALQSNYVNVLDEVEHGETA